MMFCLPVKKYCWEETRVKQTKNKEFWNSHAKKETEKGKKHKCKFICFSLICICIIQSCIDFINWSVYCILSSTEATLRRFPNFSLTYFHWHQILGGSESIPYWWNDIFIITGNLHNFLLLNDYFGT